MGQDSVVIFCMPERGHFNRLRPLISGLTAARIPTYCYTDSQFRKEVEGLGAYFADLFRIHPLENTDAESIPFPCRYVSFAGHYGEEMAREIAALQPGLIIHDTFAVIGVVVANTLDIPRVNVCAGHNLSLAKSPEALGVPWFHISDACRRGVELLRGRYRMSDATPFSYVSGLSPHLNICCEPPEFMSDEERLVMEPVAFTGSIWIQQTCCEPAAPWAFGDGPLSCLRVYVSFGTVIWRYFKDEALDALDTITDTLADAGDIVSVVGLGGSDDYKDRFARRNVRVEGYVQQWETLREASVFITHQGLNSTHEAVYHRTPMISYPFFSDQPGLAKRCQELGLAVPLVSKLRGTVSAADVRTALTHVTDRRTFLLERLTEARGWELACIAGRAAVIERIQDLIQ